MTLRREHGRLRPVVMRADERPMARPVGPDPIANGRDSKGRLTSTAAARALAKLPRKARYLSRSVACDPRFEPHSKRRLEWQRKRTAELHAMHGGVSYGVGAMLNAAAWLYAGGEFAAERAAETGDVELFKVAATLTSTARQHELGAWELSVRESEARRRTQPSPWRTRHLQEPEPTRHAERATHEHDAEHDDDEQSAPAVNVVAAIDTGSESDEDD